MKANTRTVGIHTVMINSQVAEIFDKKSILEQIEMFEKKSLSLERNLEFWSECRFVISI